MLIENFFLAFPTHPLVSYLAISSRNITSENTLQQCVSAKDNFYHNFLGLVSEVKVKR